MLPDLIQLVGIRSDREAVEADAFDSFGFRRERHDARSSRAYFETLRGQADAHSAHRFAQVIGVAQVAEVEFVHGGRAERFGVAQVEQLRAASVERVEARDVRAALRDGVGIVLRPVVEKVVGGEQAQARVGVQAVGAFVVAQSLVEGRGGERAVGIVGRGNVLQQIGPGRDPGGCRNGGVRKDAAVAGLLLVQAPPRDAAAWGR